MGGELPRWVINRPADFQKHLSTQMVSVQQDERQMQGFKDYIKDMLDLGAHGAVDGEHVDSLEHFFWGMTNGLALELGACDGTAETQSMTVGLEERFGWKRILIEGNPSFYKGLAANSSRALSVAAAICDQPSSVHFASSEARKYIGGIVENMSPSYIEHWYPSIHEAAQGNLANIKDWHNFTANIILIDCLPMSTILRHISVKHINFFVLDVEGGELSVLRTIPWHEVTFDIIVVETAPERRTPGFGQRVTEYLLQYGYEDVSGQVKRNICKCVCLLLFAHMLCLSDC